MQTFGERLHQIRSEKNLTMAALSKEIGMTPAAIARMESGDCGKNMAKLPKMARALGVSIDALFPEMDAPQEDAALQTAEQTTEEDDDLEDLE